MFHVDVFNVTVSILLCRITVNSHYFKLYWEISGVNEAFDILRGYFVLIEAKWILILLYNNSVLALLLLYSGPTMSSSNYHDSSVRERRTERYKMHITISFSHWNHGIRHRAPDRLHVLLQYHNTSSPLYISCLHYEKARNITLNDSLILLLMINISIHQFANIISHILNNFQ